MKNYDIRQLNVLLVEKHNYMRRIMRNFLSEMGVENIVDTAKPDQALQIFQEGDFDLVVTDWSPGLNGITLMQMIRQENQSKNPFVPIIVVTANTEIRHIMTARDAGMTEFLAKPISAGMIYSRICSIIERQRLFIRCQNFFGPDRRRRRMEFGGPDRRTHANAANERRNRQAPFSGSEKRQGKEGYRAPDTFAQRAR